MSAEDDRLVRSPYDDGAHDVPDVPLMTFVFEKLREGLKTWPEDKAWIVEMPSERKVLLKDVEPNAYKIASALTRLGYKKGDFTYFVTYELAQLYQIQVSIYLMGGAVRGFHPVESVASYVGQMKQVAPKFAIVESSTVEKVKMAIKELGLAVQLISVGEEKVPGTIHYSELLEDDGSAFAKDVKINPREDIANVLNTSGSTGKPKGVVHTQYSILSAVIALEGVIGIQDTMMEFMGNYGVIANCILMYDLCYGVTTYHFTYFDNFDKDLLLVNLIKYKPASMILYPHVAGWLSKQTEALNKIREMDFLKAMLVGGWVLDLPTADILTKALPNAHIKSMYGMTEMFCVALTEGRVGLDTPKKVCRCDDKGKIVASSGNMLPNSVAKVVDLTTRELLGPNQHGELLIKSATLMSGYSQGPGQPLNRSEYDEDGFFRTGDLGFYDKDKNIYVLERLSFVYKHKCFWVSPADIESVLLKHPDVLQAGVVNVPDATLENLNKAFVIRQPGSKCTEQDLVNFVAEQTPFYKHLHKGLTFVETLPTNLGGKMDRGTLKKMAIEEA